MEMREPTISELPLLTVQTTNMISLTTVTTWQTLATTMQHRRNHYSAIVTTLATT